MNLDWVLTEMAISRAQLLRILLGLPGETVREDAVFNSWRPLDVLSHAAALDEEVSQALLDLREDGDAQPALPRFREYAEARIAERRARSVEEVVDGMRGARRDLLRLVDELTAGELGREIRVGNDAYSVVEFLAQRAFRDESDREDLRKWRAELPVPVHAAGHGPGALLAGALEATRDAFRTLALRVPGGERDETAVAGRWTVKDLVGHLADRDKYTLEVLDADLAGDSLDRFLVMNFDDWNEANALARRRQAWKQVWAAMEEVRSTLMDRLANMDDTQLAEPMAFPWGEEENYYIWFFLSCQHDKDHADDLYDSIAPDKL